jgi:S1-C subfamily serine protease
MKYRILFVAVLAVAVAGPGRADDVGTAGRELLAKHQAAVVTVKLAIKQSMSMGGRDSKSESKMETTGTVIDPSGLTVVSLATTDPTSAMKDAYVKALTARGGDASQLKMESELTDVKILQADDTEISAQVVLRDKDLDLAYLRPSEKPAKPLPFIDLAQAGKAAVLDEVFVLNRLGKSANRVPALSVGRIEAVVEKPRTFYMLGQAMWGYALGAPVFARDGKLVGILFLRTVNTQTDTTSGFMFGNLNQWGMIPIVLPVADIVPGAKQALEAKPAAEK